MVTSATMLSDAVLFIRDTLKANITDPITATRPSGQKFVLTAYPKESVVYPIITIKPINVRDRILGQQSESRIVEIFIEVRIWARNVKERNELYDDVYQHLRTNQLPSATSGTSTYNNLYDFTLLSAVDIDPLGDEGEQATRSKVCEFSYMFIAT